MRTIKLQTFTPQTFTQQLRNWTDYARLAGGDVVTIAAYTATNLVQLLKAVGAAS